jgi:hypothetical protein
MDEYLAVPRAYIFVLVDGTFVVRWEAKQVQNLLNGKYRAYSDDLFGSAITNYELNQLKQAGVVGDYNDEMVYLRSRPNITPARTGRSYYLNTTHPRDALEDIQAALVLESLLEQFSVRVRDDFVVVWGKDGTAFRRFEDAEMARELLVKRMPDLFGDTVIAFVEVTSDSD